MAAGARVRGAMLPSVSEIAQEHGVTRYIAHQALRAVSSEGLFQAVPKVGTFASGQGGPEHYALLRQNTAPLSHDAELQSGFDNRIAKLGGAVLSLQWPMARREQCVPVAGVLSLTSDAHLELFAENGPFSPDLPHVRVGSIWNAGESNDLVSFDDEGGGYAATQHLLERDCRSIAFLGLHAPQLQTGRKEWSAERETGWQRALCEAGLPWHGMAFHPHAEPDEDFYNARVAGREVAGEMLKRGDVRGVVAANDALALGLIDVLRDVHLPRKSWPTIVSFDNSEAARRHDITSLHLPWEEIGSHAAELLWNRAHGQLPTTPQHRSVTMRLIPRLTCRAEWSTLAAA